MPFCLDIVPLSPFHTTNVLDDLHTQLPLAAITMHQTPIRVRIREIVLRKSFTQTLPK